MIFKQFNPNVKSKFDTFEISRGVFEELIIDAQRYAIGRMTYTPQLICEMINDNILILSDYALTTIIKDIVNNINRGNYGSKIIDLPYWLETYNLIKDELSNRGNEDLKESEITITIKLS